MTNQINIYPLRIADASRSIRHVFVRDLELDALVGVYAHEKEAHQPIIVNIDLTVDEGLEPSEDNLTNVVCYETIVKKVKSILEDGHIGLVETLAERIAERSLEDKRVAAVRIRVEKLNAIAEARSVGVEIERHRTTP